MIVAKRVGIFVKPARTEYVVLPDADTKSFVVLISPEYDCDPERINLFVPVAPFCVILFNKK